MQLSKLFKYSELCDRDHHILTPVQIHMMQSLCELVLEPIRRFLSLQYGKQIAMRVDSGVRFPSDLNRLRKLGYNPSETSDHLFGNIVKLRNQMKIRKYGKYYQYSVGAVDVVPTCGAVEAFNLLQPYFVKERSIISLPECDVPIGQVILEKRNTHWIHISNSSDVIYQETISNIFLRKEPFLKSNDNGKSYQTI